MVALAWGNGGKVILEILYDGDIAIFSCEILESARREAPVKRKNEECNRKNAGLARRTRVALLDPRRKNLECYWELRIASAMLRVPWRIRANGNGANDDAAARFD